MSVENVITLGKLIGLLFCLPSSLLLFVENYKIQGMSSSCNGNHFSSIVAENCRKYLVMTRMQNNSISKD